MAKEGRKVEAGGGPLDHPPIAPGVELTNFLPVGKTHGVAGGTHPAGHLALSKGWSYETHLRGFVTQNAHDPER